MRLVLALTRVCVACQVHALKGIKESEMMTRFLLTAATLTVLSAPAFAQTYIYQGQTDDNTLTSTNNGTISFGSNGASLGPLQGTNLNQVAGNQYNMIGQPVTGGLVSIGAGGSINQGAGGFNLTGGNTTLGGDLTLTSSNTNSATGTSTLYGNSLNVFGSQNSANVVNQAMVSGSTAGSSFDFNQVLNKALTTGASPVPVYTASLTSTNSMTGSATTGALMVGNGLQSASNSLNTGFFAGASATGTANTVNMQQNTGVIDVTGTNLALGNVTSGVAPTIDPAIVNLGQVSRTDLNSLGIGSGATALNGSQTQSGTATITFGNTAVAYTGTADLTSYNIPSNKTAGTGATSVSSTAQTALVNLNNVSGTADLALAGSGGVDAYTQTYNASLAPTSANVYSGAVNLMAANTGTGNASISGTLSTVDGKTTTSTSQAFGISGNSMAGSSLSGSLTQTATDLANASSSPVLGISPTPKGYVNVALGNSATGNASLSNVAQSGNQTYNSVAAGSASGLTLNQVTGGAMAGGNIQLAMANGNASITGASQSSNLGANVVNLGALGGSNSLTQDAGNLTMTNANTLATGPRSLSGTSGPNNSVLTGVQSAVNSLNSITR